MSSWHSQLCERLTTLLHLLRVVFEVVRRRAVQARAVTAYSCPAGTHSCTRDIACKLLQALHLSRLHISLSPRRERLHSHLWACKATSGVAFTANTKSRSRISRFPPLLVSYQTHLAFQQLEHAMQAWLWQKDLVAERCSGHEPAEDTLLLLQHPPVYTLGAGSTTDHLRFDPASPPHPLYRTERGGEVTYHGPGQLVLYPIMNLKMHMQDLHWYLRSLEEVVIRALENVSGLKGERIKGCTGVWVNNEKVAAVGVRAQKWVTYHGVAVNVTTDLQPFQNIVPCGISSRGVTSVKQLAVHEGASDEELIHEYQFGLLDAFAEVFNVELVHSKPL